MAITNERSLYVIFLNYLVCFCASAIAIGIVLVGLFAIGLNTGIILPANYAHNNLDGLKQQLQADSETPIPHPYTYAVFDDELNLIEGNNQEAIKYLKGEKIKSFNYYSALELGEKTVVISYDIKAHFALKELHELIPYPEYLLLILYGVLFLMMTVIIILNFGNQLKRELQPLKDSTERIMNQDLDFDTKPTHIKEFNEVLRSIDNLKTALSESLESQWRIEQLKKEQIAALAHDIKTPLTVIKGNAEMLTEVEFDDEDKEYLTYILKNSQKIEMYLEHLIEIAQQDRTLEVELHQINVDGFLNEIANEITMMAKVKNIEVEVERNYSVQEIRGDKELLRRALYNIVSNAIDFSEAGSVITLCIEEVKDELVFTVRDNGPGFSERGLKEATTKFYMDDKARTAGKHYGIGLYIAQTIANKHGGEVGVNNRVDERGAEVSLLVRKRYD